MRPARQELWPRWCNALSAATLCLAIMNAHAAHASQGTSGPFPAEKKPNIVFILTDDQDLHMSSLDYMPHLQEQLVNEGTTFTNHFCTVALCCPSRVSMWTGKHAHNTNVTDINPPHGGYPKFVSQGFNDNYFPLWMQDAGYDTYYTGKLFNAQSTSNYNKPYPRGWNQSLYYLDPFTYEYLNTTMQRNVERWNEDAVHEEPRSYEGLYSTDILAEQSLNMLADAIHERHSAEGSGRPFFLTIAPIAPHSNVHINVDLSDGHSNYTETTAVQSPPIAAKRHEHLFEDVVVPRTPDFNPEQNNTIAWMRTLPRQNQSNIDSNDHFYRQRLRALQAVDEMISNIIKTLAEAHVLEETYIFFSTDNGYHIGQHRLQPGKQCAFDIDINVPMVVRGPGIRKGGTTDVVSAHVDLVPTFLQLGGVDFQQAASKYKLDGRPIPLDLIVGLESKEKSPLHSAAAAAAEDAPKLDHQATLPTTDRQEHVNIEMWGVIMPEGKYGSILYPNHTYKALRLIAADKSYNLLYVVWCTNEHELYNLNTDPYALENLYPTSHADLDKKIDLVSSTTTISGDDAQYASRQDAQIPMSQEMPSAASQYSKVSVSKLVHRLDSLLMVLKTCKGRQCTHPWEQLHKHSSDPYSKVKSLTEALAPGYDSFYRDSVPRVVFQQCEQAYIRESEGPLWDEAQEDASSDSVYIWPEMLT